MKIVAIINLLVVIEGALTLASICFLPASPARVGYWTVTLIIAAILAEMALSTKWQKLAGVLTVYILSLILIPLWAIVHGSIALSSIIYIATVMLALNIIATRFQRWIINPITGIFVLSFMSYEYYTNNYLVVMPIEGELALYYIVIIPVAMIIGMAAVISLTDTYKLEHQLLAEKNQELYRLMRIDTLTGLFNKQYLNEQLKMCMSIARRKEMPMSVLVIDIDYFKNYNDLYGHIQGDKCLVKVANVLTQTAMRDSDSSYRFGGEEFVMLLNGTDKSEAKNVANRLLENIEKAKIEHEGSEISRQITVSVGIATYQGEDLITSQTLITMADKALYKAKRSGRNTICSMA